MLIKRAAGAVFDSMVFITMTTTVGLIVGILALAVTFSGPAPISRLVIAACVGIGILGGVVIALQIYAIVKHKRRAMI